MTTPVYFVLPVFAVLFGCVGFAHEIDHRFASNLRSRLSMRWFLLRRLAAAGTVGFVVCFLFAALPFVTAFTVWPALGDPGVDPTLYNETASSVAREAVGRFSYSQLLSFGPWTFGLLYSLWSGLAGAVFGVLGICALAWVKNTFVALIAPFVVSFTETIAAALAGHPHAALAYSVFPFGLTQAPIVVSAAPLLVLAGVVVAAAIATLQRGGRLEHLS